MTLLDQAPHTTGPRPPAVFGAALTSVALSSAGAGPRSEAKESDTTGGSRSWFVHGASRLITSVVKVVTNLVVTLVVIVAVVALLFFAVGPRFLDYQTATMLTGSMAPSIVPGDVVVTTEQPVGDVKVGDVISYHIPVEDHRVETHRVIDVITNQDGTKAVRTKGDANEAVDPWIATFEGDYVHEQAFIIPRVGHAIRALRAPAISTILVYGAPTVLVLGVLTMIWSRPKTTDDHSDSDSDSDSDKDRDSPGVSGGGNF